MESKQLAIRCLRPKQLALLLTCVMTCHSVAIGKGYDYFRNIRYPAVLRDDVSRDKIKQEGGPHATGDYHKRVVQWWPKRNADIVDIPKGVPLRTWTIRTKDTYPLVEMGWAGKWWDPTLRGKKEFKAHLIGFRGIGSREGGLDSGALTKAWRTEGVDWCPAVILRLPDGRKRCFVRGCFSDEDQRYILDIYEKEMKRITKTVEDIGRTTWDAAKGYPAMEWYKPGTMTVESKHFTFSSNATSAPGAPSPWANPWDKKASERYRRATFRCFEDFWAYNEYAGHLMPHWERSGGAVRYYIYVGGGSRDGIHAEGGGFGGGYGGCAILHCYWVAFFHEWGHGARCGGWALGGGETMADSGQTLGDPEVTHKTIVQVWRPYKNLFHGPNSYSAGMAYALLGDDPDWGSAMLASVSSLAAPIESSPFHTMARLGEERGLWKNGIRGVGDLFGQIGARFAEFDCEMQAGFRKLYPAPLRQFLYPLDRKQGLYRCNMAEAPEPFGCNHILLIAEPDAKEISVDFRGHFDPDTYSDWRACIVAVDETERCRYSPLFNKGTMTMRRKPGDLRYWLTVVATPYALTPIGNPRVDRATADLLQGDFAYHYPYDVKLGGCRPGGQNVPIGVNGNWGLEGPEYMTDKAVNGGQSGRCYDWPHPSDTPEYAKMKPYLEDLVVRGPEYAKLLMAEMPDKDRNWTDNRMRVSAVYQAARAQQLLEDAQGARHPNGGGWVAASATVDPTAYVGPNCMVLDGAKVLDQAIVEDYAMVTGQGVTIKDHARVSGGAVVAGAAWIEGYARVLRNINTRQGLFTRGLQTLYPEAPLYESGIVFTPPERRTTPERRHYNFASSYQGVEANYDMERSETVFLEDYFVERGSTGRRKPRCSDRDMVNYSGVLYGEPGFERNAKTHGGALTFNGKNQYAEAGPMVGDYGEVTVAVALKTDPSTSLRTGSNREQTVFDFGTSPEHCYKLLLSRSRVPSLVTVTDGKAKTLKAKQAIPAGQWVTLRIEIDGRQQSLWVDGSKVATRKSRFRPADAYPGGGDKRNSIAASREQKDAFAGALDYVRIYSQVYADFAEGGRVPVRSPRRVDEGAFDRLASFGEAQQERREQWNKAPREPVAEDKEVNAFYDEWARMATQRRQAFDDLAKAQSDPIQKETDELKARKSKARDTITKEFNARPEVVEAIARRKELETEKNKLRNELRGKNKPIADEWNKKLNEAKQRQRAADKKSRASVAEAAGKLMTESAALRKSRDVLTAEARNDSASYQRVHKAMDAKRKEVDELAKTIDRKQPDPAKVKQRDTLRNELRQLERKLQRTDSAIRSHPKIAQLDPRAKKLREQANVMYRQARDRDAAYLKASEDVARFDKQRREAEHKAYDDPRLAKLDKEIGKCHEVTQALRPLIDKTIKDIDKRVRELRNDIASAKRRAGLLHNADEYNSMPKTWETGRPAEKESPNPFPGTDSMRTVSGVYQLQQSKWVTRCDWDARLDFEKAPFDELQPYQQRWLKRMKPYRYK